MPMSALQLPSPSVSESDYNATMMADGYAHNKFEDKEDQMMAVVEYISQKGFLPEELIETEVAWFYNNLGIDNMYFSLESIEVIANHIMSLYAAKMTSYLKNASSLEIHLEQEEEDNAVYIHSSKPGISMIGGPQYEERIDEKYLSVSKGVESFRLETYRSSGVVASNFKTQLRCYFVAKCVFDEKVYDGEFLGDDGISCERDIGLVGDKIFLNKATERTLELYQSVIDKVLERSGPVIEMTEVENSRSKRLIIGYRQQSSQNFFSSMSDLYHYYDLYSTRKYVENFANGVTIMCIYLSPLSRTSHKHTAPPIEHSILQIMREASLIFCLPTTALQPLFKSGTLSVQETIYGYSALAFAQHFLNRLGAEYSTLSSILDERDVGQMEVLAKIKKRLRQETFTREYVLDIVRQYPELVRCLYINFAMTHYTADHFKDDPSAKLRPSLSFQRLQQDRLLSIDEIHEKIKKTVCNPHEQLVFESFMSFNRHVLKTNFYQPTKVALSFRLDPSFLPASEYPVIPFGMFLIIGNGFRGFHVRMDDIARGGIRIIKSRNREAYSINLRSLFDENYSLASTQQRKNKDIPEGGSKGTILLDADQQGISQFAFEKYVDSILDLLITGITPGIKEKIYDGYGKPEILFFGPDEGTAEFMDWASSHARRRGAAFWKAFTTGKSQSLGGIPHDIYGMTTKSVHTFVLGIYEKMGLNEKEITKFQTGGPDGDLGSNEIKVSRDKTIAIVDGSGVLYDPLGLDREELSLLAARRRMIANFDTSKLSKDGFRVLLDENDLRLPNGTIVDNGLHFRNNFHLNPLCKADIFVPCGGRPEAVDINNVDMLLEEQGHFKYIVEGANLFFTQDARLRLEQSGILVFKDASANKGGVTSSSLEVLAAMCLNDDEFKRHMQVIDPQNPPAFYTEYVKIVHSIIEDNAKAEFECLWRERERAMADPVTNNPANTCLSILSDKLSNSIRCLTNELTNSSVLWDNVPLRNLVLGKAIPNLLLETIGGLSVAMERLPENYLKAVYASYLASRFVYENGMERGQFAFFSYMTAWHAQINGCDAREN